VQDLEGNLARYAPLLYRVALRQLRNDEDAEDAVQDALLSTYFTIRGPFAYHDMASTRQLVQILKAGLTYFAIVFGMGFVLGTIRTLWVVPRVGTRIAELIETPVMLVVIILASRWIVLHLSVPWAPSDRLGMGGIALCLLLVAEFGLVFWLRGLSIREYLATRDPVSGKVYYLMLGVFAIMPLLVARR
jgi:Sigma-70 region 2